MTIQDINYLKENSIEDIHKYHYQLQSQNNVINLSENITNVFSVNIIKIQCTDTTQFVPFTITLYANHIIMDSIYVIDNNSIQINTRDFEKKIHPIANVSQIKYSISIPPDVISTERSSKPTLPEEFVITNLFISFSVHFYNPQTTLNNTYNDLNPQYNPHITWGSSESDSDAEY